MVLLRFPSSRLYAIWKVENSEISETFPIHQILTVVATFSKIF